MPEIKTLLIRDLDDSFQIRANGTNSEKVQQYCEMFREYHGWGSFPPLTVVSITDDDEFPPGLYIADGIHRYQAALLANVGIQEVKCEVWEGGRDLLYDKSLAVNAFQGLGMSTEELKAARKRIVLDLWPTRKYNTSRLAEICHCSDDTIRRDIKKFEDAGLVPHIDSVISANGKEYPTRYQKPTSAHAEVEKPATPAIPHEYCAGGCGTPIWDDIKEAKDCAYVQWDGKWFCSEECAQAYLTKQPEPQEPPDEDDDEYEDDEDDEPLPTCEICGISTVEPEKSGWIRTPDGRWCCSEECLNGFRKGWEQVECPRCGNKVRRMYLEKFRWVHDKEGTWFCSKECRDVWPSLLKEPDLYPRAKAHLQSRAGGQKPEQETEPEEPDEFAFTDVDEETLPVCTEEHKETDELETQIVVRVRTKAFKTAQEFVNSLSVIDGKFQIHLFGSDVDAEFLGLYENNNLINNNINTNPEIFTDFYVCCKSTKGRKVKLFISKAKYSEWKRQFGPPFDIDQNLKECCKYYNELTGSEMLSASGVYAKVFAWLLRNWKQEQKQSKPKQNAYKDAGLRFDPSDY